MKLDNLDLVLRLARDVEKLRKAQDWQSTMRNQPELELNSANGAIFITLEFSEVDAIIERFRTELAERAAELGVEL